jgi:membrane protease YdiL (CAAX protease family)
MCVYYICFMMFDLSGFFDFLRRPHYQIIDRIRVNTFITAVKIYLVSIVIIGLINSFNIAVLRAFLTLPIDKSLTVPDSLKENLWIYFLLVVIISPIMEEVIFRLSLFFDPVYLALSFSTLSALIVNKVTNEILALITFIFVFILVNRLAYIFKRTFHSFWNKNFKYIFYFLSILFGLVHITNYNFTESSQYFVVIILIIPQLAIGLILSYTRVYYAKGFLICILFHIIMNLVSTSFYLIKIII